MGDLEGMINSVLSNPDEMKKIMDVASSLMAGNGEAPSESVPPPPPPTEQENTGPAPDLSELIKGVSLLPPEIGAAAMKLLQGVGGGAGSKNEKHTLLNAMKPYLSEGRRTKLDRAMQLARVLGMGLSLFGKNGGLL